MSRLVDYDSDSSDGTTNSLDKADASNSQSGSVSGHKRKRPQEGSESNRVPIEKDDLWPLLVFIPVPITDTLKQLAAQYKQALESNWKSAFTDTLGVTRNFVPTHISLSRNIRIRHAEINPLMRQLRNALTDAKVFNISFNALQIFYNEDKTRCFASLLIGSGIAHVLALIKAVDAVFIANGHPAYYEVSNTTTHCHLCNSPLLTFSIRVQPPDPHASIAYADVADLAMGNDGDERTGAVLVDGDTFRRKHTFTAEDLSDKVVMDVVIPCPELHIAVGNRCHVISLRV